MTLDDLLREARAELEAGPANRRFWKALQKEIDSSLSGHRRAKQIEIGQRVMVLVWQKIDRYEQRGPNSMQRWVRAIIRLEVRRTRFEAARLARLESRLLRDVPRSPGLTPSRHLLLLERVALVEQATGQLSDRHRRALDLADPYKVASSERISIDAARMLIHRALRRLALLVDDLRKTGRVRPVTSS